LDAEAEWLQNAPDTYGDDAGEIWAEEIFPRLLIAQLQETDCEDLLLYVPKFLSRVEALTSASSTFGELRALLQPFKSEF